MDNVREGVKDIIASVFGSAASAVTGQPFGMSCVIFHKTITNVLLCLIIDTLKVRLQVGSSEFRNTWMCIRSTVSHEGVRALWKGLSPAFVGAVSENATAFALNGQFNRLLGPVESREKSYINPFIMGAAAGFVTAFVLCPSDIIKCRQQVLRSTGRDVACGVLISELFATHGVRGFYIGIGAQILRDVPFFACFFGVYELLCPIFTRHMKLPDDVAYFVAGGLAGQCAWIASLPFDAVKSVVQTNGVRNHALTGCAIQDMSEAHRSHNSLRVARHMHSMHGPAIFFRGLGITVLRAFPSNAALFLGYEWARKVVYHTQ